MVKVSHVDLDVVAAVVGIAEIHIGAHRGAFRDEMGGVVREVDCSSQQGTFGDEFLVPDGGVAIVVLINSVDCMLHVLILRVDFDLEILVDSKFMACLEVHPRLMLCVRMGHWEISS